jgi:hypothetical protein
LGHSRQVSVSISEHILRRFIGRCGQESITLELASGSKAEAARSDRSFVVGKFGKVLGEADLVLPAVPMHKVGTKGLR